MVTPGSGEGQRKRSITATAPLAYLTADMIIEDSALARATPRNVTPGATAHLTPCSRSAKTSDYAEDLEPAPAGGRRSRRPARHNSGLGIKRCGAICEGDLHGKSREEIRSLHFRRDPDWLLS
jgi:hypothetical protein